MNSIINTSNFNLELIINSGQVFNWFKFEDGYIGHFIDFVIFIKQVDNDLYWESSTKDINEAWIKHYFDLDFDYYTFKDKIKQTCNIAYKSLEMYDGLRILNQDPVQKIISFILATNKNIKAIRKSISWFIQDGGQLVNISKGNFNTFPSLNYFNVKSVNELSPSGIGYRSKYLKHAIEMMLTSDLLNRVSNVNDYYLARDILKSINGVGNKVADCVLGFSLGYKNITPIDRWAERLVNQTFKESNIKKYEDYSKYLSDRYGEYTALVGLFLFEWIRNNYNTND